MSTAFRPVSYGPCSRTGVTSVGSDLTILFMAKIITISLKFDHQIDDQ